MRVFRTPLLLALLLACMPTLAAPSPELLRTEGAVYVDVELQILELVNRERVARGLTPLAHEPALSELAREHSDAMASGGRPFGHEAFPERARRARSVVPASREVWENVATNVQDRSAAASGAVQQWLTSDGHREAIHDPARAATGIGVSRGRTGVFFYTQIFVAQAAKRELRVES
jgi:uncharacterized protein YkwD